MNIIVVEGIDRVGKTTLVNRLCDWYDYDPYMKFNVFKHAESHFPYDKMDSDNETDKMLQLIDMVKTCDGNVIFDRFHLSEFVYGICNRDYKFSTAYMNRGVIDNALVERGAVLLYVVPTSVTWSSNQHGSDLYMHNELMQASFEDSGMKKLATGFAEIEDDKRFDALAMRVRDMLTEV